MDRNKGRKKGAKRRTASTLYIDDFRFSAMDFSKISRYKIELFGDIKPQKIFVIFKKLTLKKSEKFILRLLQELSAKWISIDH